MLIGGVLAWNAIRPSDERLSDSAQVQVTIGQYYGALNKGRYSDLIANTCAKDRSAADFPKEAGFPDARKAAVERDGEARELLGEHAPERLRRAHGPRRTQTAIRGIASMRERV